MQVAVDRNPLALASLAVARLAKVQPGQEYSCNDIRPHDQALLNVVVPGDRVTVTEVRRSTYVQFAFVSLNIHGSRETKKFNPIDFNDCFDLLEN